jgi:hypothetical protein
VYPVPYSLILLQTEAYIRPGHFFAAVVLFSGLILVLIAGMGFILIRKNRRALREKQLQGLFQDWLVGIILEETDAQHPGFAVPEGIRRVLLQGFARQELLQELQRLKKSLSGQPAENLEKLYRQLDLAGLSARSLRSRRWHRKARGIQELAAMNQAGFVAEIYPLTNHRHPVVRMEAQIALVFLQQYQGLGFFEDLVHPLTQWHQMKLLQLLASQPIPSAADITRWLQSPNVSVVQFTLRLIGEQHAGNFQQEVIACLCHPDETIRRQAIACLGEIPSAPAAKALRDLFRREPDKSLQIAILAELIKTGTAGDRPFLQELRQAPDAEIRLAADKALLQLQSQVAA